MTEPKRQSFYSRYRNYVLPVYATLILLCVFTWIVFVNYSLKGGLVNQTSGTKLFIIGLAAIVIGQMFSSAVIITLLEATARSLSRESSVNHTFIQLRADQIGEQLTHINLRLEQINAKHLAESALIVGPAGPAGPPGPPGLDGLRGFVGLEGLSGINGTEGIQGVQGIQGIQGIQGRPQ